MAANRRMLEIARVRRRVSLAMPSSAPRVVKLACTCEVRWEGVSVLRRYIRGREEKKHWRRRSFVLCLEESRTFAYLFKTKGERPDVNIRRGHEEDPQTVRKFVEVECVKIAVEVA